VPPNHISLPHRSQNQKLSSEEKINSTIAGQTLKVVKSWGKKQIEISFQKYTCHC
jgi:hypothetical protein